eukprot:jgi/Mesvir1/10535/Mv21771-RA.2
MSLDAFLEGAGKVRDRHTCDLSPYGLRVKAFRNLPAGILYEDAIRFDNGEVTSTGALRAQSLPKTGRSPQDKRIVDVDICRSDVWWGDVNIPLKPEVYRVNRKRAVDFLSQQPHLYVVDAYANWDTRFRIKLFMTNMLIRPSEEELAADFGTESIDYVIFNAGEFPADDQQEGVTSSTSVAVHFGTREMVILGTHYAGEMKKGVFTIINYIMPKQGVLSMHASANQAPHDGDTTVFFGLSGTGKTTLSADPHRDLIGDDEICWCDDGVFNVEGGCYAKCINLSAEKEPEIFGAIRYGCVLENTVHDPVSRVTNYDDASLTENTRASYPIEFIPNAKIPCVGKQPSNIIFLACDAFGVLPPVSKLTPDQAEYHFISGYSAKVAGTEMGVKEPTPVFSACFGAPFMVWHPGVYARLLSQKVLRNSVPVWLVNTGWTGGAYGTGHRMSLKHTRAIIDAIHAGHLKDVPTTTDAVFGLQMPTSCPGVPSEILNPRSAWKDKHAYDRQAEHLAELFDSNFQKFVSGVEPAVAKAGPKLGRK